MLLNKKQKNHLYDLITSFNLSPSLFTISMDDSRKFTHIFLNERGNYYFLIQPSDDYYGNEVIAFSPGSDSMTDRVLASRWQKITDVFMNWLHELKYELETPDYWEELSKFHNVDQIEFNNSTNQRFTYNQVQDIENAVATIKSYLLEHNLILEDKLDETIRKLDEINESSKRLTMKDFANAFIGSMVGIAMTNGLNQVELNSVIQVFKAALTHIQVLLK